jgi:UDP-N-acetylglucosamine:LPS N-acetylglucosamine transferase
MIFFNAIPGQETNTIRVLKGYGVGLSDCPIPLMAQVLRDWQSHPAELQAAKEKSRALAKPSAVQDIISLLK